MTLNCIKRLLLLMLTLCAFAASQAQVRWNAEASAIVQRILTTTDKPINIATGVHVGYIF